MRTSSPIVITGGQRIWASRNRSHTVMCALAGSAATAARAALSRSASGVLVSPETSTPLADRLSAARAAVAAEPARAHMTVWLRFRLAQIRWPPVITIGEEVRIYRGDWLRSCLCAPAPHHDLPAEAVGEDVDALREFCDVEPADVEAGGPPHDPTEIPAAYIRVVVGDQFAARAVSIARSNAEAIAALGAV